jgi:hypothetical protein
MPCHCRFAGLFALVLPALVWPATSPAAVSARDSVVPFTLVRNKVLVPVRVNGSRPLRLILDSGMGFDGVLLFDRSLEDSIGPARLFAAKIPGAGGGPPSDAILADSLSLQVGGTRIDNQRIIVLSDSSMVGRTSDGVIGYSLLGHYAVEIDYDRLAITLHDARSFQAADDWTSLPLTLNERNWPFLEVSAAVDSEALLPLKVYIDCASSESLELLTKAGMRFQVPAGSREVILGRGLSGDIRGRRGTISRLLIGPYELKNVVAAFVPAEIRSKAKGTDAVLSNGALCRFNVVFDYARSRLLVRPNGHLPEVFE